jgi:hypothetical protein
MNLAIASNLAHLSQVPARNVNAGPARISAHYPATRPATHASVSGSGIDPTFDYVVSLLAPRFRVSASQFADFAAMRENFNAFGFLTVNGNFSDRTIYGTAWTNFQFRAWHDSAHIACDSDFSRAGETEAMRLQIAQVWKLRGPSGTDKHRWACILDAEILGQLDAYELTGEFVEDQRAFTIEYLQRVHGLDAARFPRTLDGLTIEY